MWQYEVASQGFSTLERVLDPAEINELLEQLESRPLVRGRAGARNGLTHSAIRSAALDSRLLGIARQVLGDTAQPFRATLFDKSPSANWLVAWHQDTLLPLRERRHVTGWGPWSLKAGIHYARATSDALSRVIALRLFLDDSSVLNGPLRVLPGTHTLGVLETSQVEQLGARLRARECPGHRGAVLVMRPLLVHSSSKSKVVSSRRVLHLEYAESLHPVEGLELAVA